MPTVTLPDGSRREFDQPVTIHEVAADIGPGLAKAALAGRLAGELVDTSPVIDPGLLAADLAPFLVVGRNEVVDRHDFELFSEESLFHQSPEYQAANAAESVNCYFRCHSLFL